MCGIVGLYRFDRQPISENILEKMNRTLTHRGPDSEGKWVKGHVGLAMRRLKVIDLATGDQPIRNANDTKRIVFNGEIYNYRDLKPNLIARQHTFYTQSDTEVLLHQLEEDGPECVHRFNGMFAFAIYDLPSDGLFIARDRLGVKPLFYYHGPEGFAFASEIKALLECPWVSPKLDLQAISNFLSYNYLPASETPYATIRQLEAGHWIQIKGRNVTIQKYWDIPFKTDETITESEALQKLDQLLHRSIERRLIADVPVGAFLSGGLDSSTLVAYVKDHRDSKLETFSVGFDAPGYDETPFAQEVARYFGTQHHEIWCHPKDVETHLDSISFHADNLLADQAALPLYLVSKLAREHVTVALSGDGGDELFIGYPTFQANHYHRLMTQLPQIVQNLISAGIERLPVSMGKVSTEYKLKKFIQARHFSPEKAHYSWRTIFTLTEKKNLLRPEIFKQIAEPEGFGPYEQAFRAAASLPFDAQCLYADLKIWLGGNNLWKVDSMSMAHGLEARVPFLDYELVEFMASLPMSIKFKNRRLKYLLKKLVSKKLPQSILRRPKAGWHAPIGGWMRRELRPTILSELLKKNGLINQFFNPNTVETLIHNHLSGTENNTFKLWGLLILNSWAKQHPFIL